MENGMAVEIKWIRKTWPGDEGKGRWREVTGQRNSRRGKREWA